ncbi:MAG: hypothetical protein ACYC3K_13455 [Candidatus Nanopelagicales bacterium]
MRARWVVAPLVAACLLAYAQVVSGVGLLAWLVPAAVIAWAAVSLVQVLAPRAAPVAVWPVLAVTTLGWATLAETLGGDISGPITRGSLLVGGLTGAMAALQRTRYPAALLVPVVAMLGGALALGAADGLLAVAGLFAVAALWALLLLGPYRLPDLRDGRRALPVAAVMLLAGVTAVAATAVSAGIAGEPWTIPGAELNKAPTAAIDAATTEPAPDQPSDAPSASPAQTPSPAPSATADATDPLEEVGAGIADALRDVVLPAALGMAIAGAFLLVLWLAALLAWRLWVTARWAATRRRLAAGAPRDAVLGAWAWARLRLDQAGSRLAPAASPDVVADGSVPEGLPHDIADDLAILAGLAARAGFSRDDDAGGAVGAEDAAALAWALARDVESALRRRRTLGQWWRLTARRPSLGLLAADPEGTPAEPVSATR